MGRGQLRPIKAEGALLGAGAAWLWWGPWLCPAGGTRSGSRPLGLAMGQGLVWGCWGGNLGAPWGFFLGGAVPAPLFVFPRAQMVRVISGGRSAALPVSVCTPAPRGGIKGIILLFVITEGGEKKKKRRRNLHCWELCLIGAEISSFPRPPPGWAVATDSSHGHRDHGDPARDGDPGGTTLQQPCGSVIPPGRVTQGHQVPGEPLCPQPRGGEDLGGSGHRGEQRRVPGHGATVSLGTSSAGRAREKRSQQRGQGGSAFPNAKPMENGQLGVPRMRTQPWSPSSCGGCRGRNAAPGGGEAPGRAHGWVPQAGTCLPPFLAPYRPSSSLP